MIEIVEFYPSFSNGTRFRGTMHIYLTEHSLDIRGVYVSGSKKKMFFQLPFRIMKDAEGEMIKVPLIQFLDKKKHTKIMRMLNSLGTQYIKENWKDFFPQ